MSLQAKRALGLDVRVGLRVADPPNLRGLWPHQVEGVRFLRGGNERLLALGMGCGKSAVALRSLATRDRAIAPMPASLIEQWAAQCARWRPDLRPVEGKLRRPAEGELLLISWDSLRATKYDKRMSYEPMSDVTLIPDELDRAKNDEAMRSFGWRLLMRQCRRVWGLTGTPMPNTREDLWGVLKSCRLDRALRTTWPAFKALEPEEVKDLLAPFMLRRHQRDVFPSVVERDYGNITVDAPKDLREFLNGVPREAWAKLDQGTLPPFELISEALAALAKSRAEPGAAFASANATRDEPLLVFSNYREPVKMIGQLPGCASFDGTTPRKVRDEAVRDFQAGKLRALGCTIATGGVGLDLFAAANILFTDRSFVPAWNDQAEYRAARPGQKRPRIRIWRMISDHPLDVRMQEILDRKEREIRETIG